MSSEPPSKRLKQLALKIDVIPRRPLQQQEAVQNETRPDDTSITVSVTAEVHCDPDTRPSTIACSSSVPRQRREEFEDSRYNNY